MNENNKNEIDVEEKGKNKIQFRNLFYHNTFVLVFSFLCAVVAWFFVSAANTEDRPRTIYDVPITIELSDSAKEEGIRVFYQSYTTADVDVTGNNVIINRVSGDDLSVVARLAPNSTKLTGNTMASETISLTAQKNGNTLADYAVSAVSPETLNVLYDRYKEANFRIENNMQFTTTAQYYISTPTFSEETVVVSGPESSVNKVSYIAVKYDITEPLTETKNFTADLVAYDENGTMLDMGALYLTLSTSSIDVNVPVLSRQTVVLDVTKLNVPEGFSDSRITIEPETIDIAGDMETISNYKTIILPTAIDFNTINTQNYTFTMDIPMPTGVRNISNVTEATVTVNLSGFADTTIDVSNFEFLNVPAGKTVTVVTKSIPVSIVGSQTQVARLTTSSVYGIIDMANLADNNGNAEVPVAINISGATSCWVYGHQYTIQVSVQDEVVEAVASEVSNSDDSSE